MTKVFARSFNKRETERSDWSGQVGAIELKIDGDKWFLDGKELPEQSINHLGNFALQSLQDSYAGAASLNEAIERFQSKFDKLVTGTLGLRSGAAGKPAYWKFVRNFFRVVKDVKSTEAYKEADDRNQFLDDLFDNQTEATQKKIIDWAEAELAKELTRAKDVPSIDIDI